MNNLPELYILGQCILNFIFPVFYCLYGLAGHSGFFSL